MKSKRVIILLLILTITTSFSFSFQSIAAKPEEIYSYNQIKTKQDLVSYANHKEALKSKETRDSYFSEDSKRMLAKMIIEGENINTIELKMEHFGIYIYNPTNNLTTVSPMTEDNSDVKINRPTIAYNSSNRQWTISAGGYWLNDSWVNEVPLFSHNIGGYDAYGVGFTSTSGTYSSAIISSYCFIEDQNCKTVKSTYNRSDGNGSLGFGFRLQDYVVPPSKPYAAPSYVGYRFYVETTYNSNFTKYNGVATTYYAHTWNSTQVNSVSFGVSGKQAGVSFNLNTNTPNEFTAFSSDSTF